MPLTSQCDRRLLNKPLQQPCPRAGAVFQPMPASRYLSNHSVATGRVVQHVAVHLAVASSVHYCVWTRRWYGLLLLAAACNSCCASLVPSAFASVTWTPVEGFLDKFNCLRQCIVPVLRPQSLILLQALPCLMHAISVSRAVSDRYIAGCAQVCIANSHAHSVMWCQTLHQSHHIRVNNQGVWICFQQPHRLTCWPSRVALSLALSQVDFSFICALTP